MDGTELAARFSYVTNSLRFCGPEEASHQFVDYIKSRNDPKKVQDSLRKFEGLYPYLSAIAEKTGGNFFDYDVVESYWIGNKLLESFDDNDMKRIIQKLMQRGLPKSIGKELIERLPIGLMPHHNFNVYYVGVGRTTGSVEFTLSNMDNCRISYGKVVDVLNDKLIVTTRPLKKEQNKLFLGEEETRTAVFMKEMLPDIKKNDFVALHWGFAPLVLTDAQVKNLEKYNKKILEIL